MLTDLENALFHAGVEFIEWRSWHHAIRHQDNVYSSGKLTRVYLPEPNIQLGGTYFTISEICDLAAVLKGPLPPFLSSFYCRVVPGIFSYSDDEVPDYPAAVE